MNAKLIRHAIFSALALSGLLASRPAEAQITSVINANVQAYFTGSSDANQFSDPTGLTPWTPAGFGPYGVTGVPNVPGPPGSPVFPGILAPGNSFVGSYSTSFADGPATGSLAIAPPLLGGGNVSDGTPQAFFSLFNPSTLYGFLQADFEINYTAIGPLGGLGAPPAFTVTGFTSGIGSYAQFAGRMEYWWQPVNADGTVAGPFVSLGLLDYNWTQIGAGAFSQVVTPSSSTLVAAPATGGNLAVVGELYVAGDPAVINVASVPEPSSGLLIGSALVSVALFVALRRRTVA